MSKERTSSLQQGRESAPRVVIVMPAYNEARTLAATVKDLPDRCLWASSCRYSRARCR